MPDRAAAEPLTLGRPGHDRSQRLRREVERIARRQHGVLSVAQARAAGATASWLKCQVVEGFLVRCDHGVVRLGGVASTWESSLMRACLARGPETVLSFGTAARLRQLDLGKWPEQRIEVSVPQTASHRSTPDVRVHTTRRISSSDRCLWDQLPVTTVARTILDLAGILQPDHLARLIDDALLTKKTTLPLLTSTLRRMSRPGFGGAPGVRRALAPWVEGTVESHAEATVLRALLAAGVPQPVCQHEIRVGDVLVARVDFAWPRQHLILEVDGFQFHDGPTKFGADRHRWNRLEALGWRVLKTTVWELKTDQCPLFGAIEANLRC